MKDARNFARQITKAIQKIAPSVVLLPGHKKQLVTELMETTLHPLPTLDELLKAATAEANDWGSNEFKIGQGANLLIGKLLNSVEIAREREEETRKTAEMVARCVANEQARARQEAEELAARELAESVLIEDSLPVG